jgi:hypothetical protein
MLYDMMQEYHTTHPPTLMMTITSLSLLAHLTFTLTHTHSLIGCSLLQEYDSLTDKYSQSLSLLQSYALFCDHVLNDPKAAQKARVMADAVEDLGLDVESRAGSSLVYLSMSHVSSMTTSQTVSCTLPDINILEIWLILET